MLNNQIYIVDDDTAMLASLSWVFEGYKFIVHSFKNPLDFLNSIQDKMRGCILLDVKMPILSGLEVLYELKLRANKLPIIMMTGFGDIPMAVTAIKNGAIDFITKPINQQYLLNIVHDSLLIANNECKPKVQLSPRQSQVLELIIQGKLNKQIAAKLNISLSTVELHRRHLMRKMNANTVAELIKNYLS